MVWTNTVCRLLDSSETACQLFNVRLAAHRTWVLLLLIKCPLEDIRQVRPASHPPALPPSCVPEHSQCTDTCHSPCGATSTADWGLCLGLRCAEGPCALFKHPAKLRLHASL